MNYFQHRWDSVVFCYFCAMKKVLCYPSNNRASGAYRITEPYRVMPGKIAFDIEDGGVLDMDLALTYDAVVFQLVSDSGLTGFIDEFQDKGGRVVYEIDDDLFHMQVDNPAAEFYDGPRLKIVRDIMGSCDAVHTTTPALAKSLATQWPVTSFFAMTRPQIMVFPNAIDLNKYQSPEEVRLHMREYLGFSEDDVVVMWAGSPHHVKDIGLIMGVEKILKDESHIKFLFISNKFWLGTGGIKDCENVKVLDWVPFGEFHLYQSAADISLAPLAQSRYNDSVSELKCIEAAAWGIPTICSHIGPYTRFTGVSGDAILIGAESVAAWAATIKWLAQNPGKRKTIGSRARQQVVHGMHNLDNVNQLRLSWWKKFLG